MAVGIGWSWQMDAESEIRLLKHEVESLRQRVTELESRWELQILGGVNAELAELRGTVKAQAANLERLHELVLKRLIP
jgi:hypothetical protein